MTLWTVGHGTRPAEELLAILASVRIARLADVRTVPRSRHNPQFNRDTLPATLRAAHVDYVHLAALGGLRKTRADSVNTAWRNLSFRGYADYMQTPAFAAGLDELRALAAAARTAIMCAETVPWRCHRSLIADALTARGDRVEHLLAAGRADVHVLSRMARVEDGRVTYPAEAARPPADGTLPLF